MPQTDHQNLHIHPHPHPRHPHLREGKREMESLVQLRKKVKRNFSSFALDILRTVSLNSIWNNEHYVG